jgi:hypothetical protein
MTEREWAASVVASGSAMSVTEIGDYWRFETRLGTVLVGGVGFKLSSDYEAQWQYALAKKQRENDRADAWKLLDAG